MLSPREPEKCLYAWWKCTPDGLLRKNSYQQYPVPHHATTVTPGMGNWILLHLLEPTSQDELPPGVILATEVQKLLSEKVK